MFIAPPSPTHAADPDAKPEPLALKDGDRVVFVGNTLIGAANIRYGLPVETALTRALSRQEHCVPQPRLGMATPPFGARSAGTLLASAADGFNHRKQHVAELKPTVILVGYGANEAFDGEEGLPHFLDGLNKMLDSLAETKSRIVLLSPPRQEDMGRPLPDPTEQNKNIRLYGDAMRKVAEKRGYLFCDPQSHTPDAILKLGLTDNGIHLTDFGYWATSIGLLQSLNIPADRLKGGFAPRSWGIDVDTDKKTAEGQCAKVALDKDNPLRWQVTDDNLPLPYRKGVEAIMISVQTKMRELDRRVHVHGLADSTYTLSIDGKVVYKATAKQWDEGVVIFDGPEFDQAEKLRAAIVEKNRLYFHRWRPQNETYLFGFRKGEQGQNAPEIPKFDPLVAKQEEEIAKLRVPVAHTYELKPQRA